MGIVLSPNCPRCDQKLPAIRNPTSLKQAFWGGWTCENCRCEINRFGEEIVEKNQNQISPIEDYKIEIPIFLDEKGKPPVERLFEEENK